MERGEEVQICGSPHDGGEHGRGMQLPMMQHIECSVFLSKSLSSGEKKNANSATANFEQLYLNELPTSKPANRKALGKKMKDFI